MQLQVIILNLILNAGNSMKKYILDKNIRLKHDKASEKYYAFCVSSGDHYVLTRTGYFILELLEKGKNIDEIINFIYEKEKIDLDICKTDIMKFLNKSEKIGIIVIDKEDSKNDKKE